MAALNAFISRFPSVFYGCCGAIITSRLYGLGLLVFLLTPSTSVLAAFLLIHLAAPSFHGCIFSTRSLIVFCLRGRHTLNGHTYMLISQMYTHPFVCVDYTFNLRPRDWQKFFLCPLFSISSPGLFYSPTGGFV